MNDDLDPSSCDNKTASNSDSDSGSASDNDESNEYFV